MISYTLNPFLLTPIQTTAAWKINFNDCAVINFYVLLHAAYYCFFSHHVSVFSNLSSAEKASVKEEGRLLTDCAYEALTLWVCMFLNFHNAPAPQRLIVK